MTRPCTSRKLIFSSSHPQHSTQSLQLPSQKYILLIIQHSFASSLWQTCRQSIIRRLSWIFFRPLDNSQSFCYNLHIVSTTSWNFAVILTPFFCKFLVTLKTSFPPILWISVAARTRCTDYYLNQRLTQNSSEFVSMQYDDRVLINYNIECCIFETSIQKL